MLGQGKSLEHAHELARRARAERRAQPRAAPFRGGTTELGRPARRGRASRRRTRRSICWRTVALYQAVSSRIWARTGFYQSSGAYGFRDQLQDVLAVLHARPALAREHLLRCAARQFAEGDVQHWWHEETRRGPAHALLRRHALAAVCDRANTSASTGDRGVLDEARALPHRARCSAPSEEDLFSAPDDRPSRAPRCTSTARARSTSAPPRARTAYR